MSLLVCAMFFGLSALAAAEKFDIVISREKAENNLVTGTISVNGEVLGTCYEREDLRIAAGTYPGFLRYGSKRGFAQGPNGELGQEGDFLLEIGNVKWSDGKVRTNLLFHGGNKPEHSKGCVMLGAVARGADGKAILPERHPLRKLRFLFYGTDDPTSTPNKQISITIKDF
jgi:hypothetical protein